MRHFFAIIAVLVAGSAQAEGWSVTLDVEDGPSFADEGDVNSIMTAPGAAAYMSAEAYVAGYDGGTTCETGREFEIDYFFGQDTGYGGHLLFTLLVEGGQATAQEPAIFYDQKDGSGSLILVYSGFEDTAVRVDRFGCLPDGSMDLAVTYKGRLLLEEGNGPQTVQVSGNADAALIMFDMDDY